MLRIEPHHHPTPFNRNKSQGVKEGFELAIADGRGNEVPK